jgi:hypothetical protein
MASAIFGADWDICAAIAHEKCERESYNTNKSRGLQTRRRVCGPRGGGTRDDAHRRRVRHPW